MLSSSIEHVIIKTRSNEGHYFALNPNRTSPIDHASGPRDEGQGFKALCMRDFILRLSAQSNVLLEKNLYFIWLVVFEMKRTYSTWILRFYELHALAQTQPVHDNVYIFLENTTRHLYKSTHYSYQINSLFRFESTATYIRIARNLYNHRSTII